MLFICPQMNTDEHRFIKSDFICVYLCSSVDNFSSALLFVHYQKSIFEIASRNKVTNQITK